MEDMALPLVSYDKGEFAEIEWMKVQDLTYHASALMKKAGSKISHGSLQDHYLSESMLP